MKKNLLIGVTGPDYNHKLSWAFISASLLLTGAAIVRLTPANPQKRSKFDGIIISGGKDIKPELYGQKGITDYPYDFERDELETYWVKKALENKIPLLGLCRGAQLINVVLGGTLHMDIRLLCETAKYPETILSKVFARKPVIIKNDSLLHAIFRREVVNVNSLHRQAIDRIGNGLEVTAREENNIIQAIEGIDKTHFILGVQWHPEFMYNTKRQRLIFRTFVNYARKVKESAGLTCGKSDKYLSEV